RPHRRRHLLHATGFRGPSARQRRRLPALGPRRARHEVLQTQTSDRTRPAGTAAGTTAPTDPERGDATSDRRSETHPTRCEGLWHHDRCVEAEEEWLSG